METFPYNYFAYGSNMNFLQMEQRCPGARFLGRGILPNYRFHLYSRGYASVMKYEGATVWGGIWKISGSHLATLDRYEGVAENCYYRKSIDIFLADQNGSENVLECEIYFGSDSQDGTVEARDGYLDDILEGARNTNLPHEYISGVLYPWKS